MKEKYLINGRIIDPKNQVDEIGGLIIDSKGLIKAVGRKVVVDNLPKEAEKIDLKNSTPNLEIQIFEKKLQRKMHSLVDVY